MSGIEFLGAFAAAAQIASQAQTIIEAILQIYGVLRKTPTKIQQGCRHLQHLVDTMQAIKQNECLQTPSTEAHVKALVERIMALQNMLTRILSGLDGPCFKRLAVACFWSRYEIRLTEALSQIEGEKSALILNILNINAQSTYSTNESLRELIKDLSILRETGDEVKAFRNLSSTILRAVNGLHKRDAISCNKQHFETTLDSNVNGTNTSYSKQLCEKQLKSTNMAETSTSNINSIYSGDNETEGPCSSDSHHIYQGVEKRDRVQQINGDVGSPSNISNFKNHYIGVMASGSGWQLNGNISADGLLQLSSILAKV